jgi:hypothetical protein
MSDDVIKNKYQLYKVIQNKTKIEIKRMMTKFETKWDFGHKTEITP